MDVMYVEDSFAYKVGNYYHKNMIGLFLVICQIFMSHDSR